jgi:hypothetical protein
LVLVCGRATNQKNFRYKNNGLHTAPHPTSTAQLPERITTQLRESGLELEQSTGASFGKTIASDLEQWREVVNTNKITLQ